MTDLLPISPHPRPVEYPVDFPRPSAGPVRRLPGFAELSEIRSSTLRAWPVSRCQRHRLVEKEQLGVPPWRHRLPLPALEVEKAGDPRLVPPAGHPEFLPVVMQDSPVSHQPAPVGGVSDDLAGRQDTVLERHRVSSAEGRRYCPSRGPAPAPSTPSARSRPRDPPLAAKRPRGRSEIAAKRRLWLQSAR